MPALRISIDEAVIAMVSLDDLELMALNIFGNRVDDACAIVDLSGGRYPQTGESTHLIWISDLQLRSGQSLTLEFCEAGASSHAGKTIEDYFGTEVAEEPPMSMSERLAEIRSMPSKRAGYSLKLTMSSGLESWADTKEDEHAFGFSTLWTSDQPERARLALHSSRLDSIEAHSPLRYHANETLQYGDWVRFKVTELANEIHAP